MKLISPLGQAVLFCVLRGVSEADASLCRQRIGQGCRVSSLAEGPRTFNNRDTPEPRHSRSWLQPVALLKQQAGKVFSDVSVSETDSTLPSKPSKFANHNAFDDTFGLGPSFLDATLFGLKHVPPSSGAIRTDSGHCYSWITFSGSRCVIYLLEDKALLTILYTLVQVIHDNYPYLTYTALHLTSDLQQRLGAGTLGEPFTNANSEQDLVKLSNMSLSKPAYEEDRFPEMGPRDPPQHPGTYEKHEAWVRAVRLWAKASKMGKTEPECLGPSIALACRGKAQLIVQRILSMPGGLEKLAEPADVPADRGHPPVDAKMSGLGFLIDHLEKEFRPPGSVHLFVKVMLFPRCSNQGILSEPIIESKRLDAEVELSHNQARTPEQMKVPEWFRALRMLFAPGVEEWERTHILMDLKLEDRPWEFKIVAVETQLRAIVQSKEKVNELPALGYQALADGGWWREEEGGKEE